MPVVSMLVSEATKLLWLDPSLTLYNIWGGLSADSIAVYGLQAVYTKTACNQQTSHRRFALDGKGEAARTTVHLHAPLQTARLSDDGQQTCCNAWLVNGRANQYHKWLRRYDGLPLPLLHRQMHDRCASRPFPLHILQVYLAFGTSVLFLQYIETFSGADLLAESRRREGAEFPPSPVKRWYGSLTVILTSQHAHSSQRW
ncbi:hypothetical protein F5Y19DRAFT_4712 [Xylariaceae sp. FL1651]|nr:hypothetical protein F5Y19DRAFT_4712 [Xylariaceae sp. FL1651]